MAASPGKPAACICLLLTCGFGASEAAAQDQPEALTPPELVHFEPAVYPPALAESRTEAAVLLAITIDREGQVTAVEVRESAGPEFDAAAVGAAERFVFEPARRGDEPVPAQIQYNYVFELEPDAPPPPETGSLVGRLQSEERPLAEVQVTLRPDNPVLPERSVRSNINGEFRFEDLPPGGYRIELFRQDVEDFTTREEVIAGGITEVTYRPTLLELTDLEDDEGFGAEAVIEAPPREVVRRTIPREHLTVIPGTRGDALRAVELLPGVGRPPGGSGQLIVRGAAPQDSEVFFEGVSVPQLYHFGGLTSIVNSRLIEQIDFYPGNFSARFGRRTGGILEVEFRDPAPDGGFGGMLELGVIDSSVLVEGEIVDNLSLALGFRRSILELILSGLSSDDIGIISTPVYYDYQAILSWRPTSTDRIRFFAYGFDDGFELNVDDLDSDDPTVRGDADLAISSLTLHLDWEREVSDTVRSKIDLSYGPRQQNFAFGEDLSLDATLHQVHIRSEWQIELSPALQLIAGTDGFLIPFTLDLNAPRFGQSEGGGTTDSLAAREQVDTQVTSTIMRPGLYSELAANLGPVRFVLGLRLDYYGEIESWTFDPRLTTVISLSDQFRIKTGVGLYGQPPEFNESAEDIGNPNLEPIRSVHTGAGFEWEPAPGVELSVEGFYKRLWNRVVATEGSVAPFYENRGIGRIYGGEFGLRLTPEDGNYFAYVSYTLSRSERRDNPGDPWRLFDFDQTHILSATLSYRFPANWRLGATFRLVSGNPTTPVVGSIYDATNDVYQPVDGSINSQRDPLFHRLDLRLEKIWEFDDWKFAFFIDVQNAYNRQNAEGISFNYDYSESEQISGLPIIPSIGVRGEL
ncbi:MAG: TonB family protein [Myxococcota bacterium]